MKMKTKKFKRIFIIAFIVFLFLILSFIIISSQNIFSADLVKGKNYIQLNVTEPFYVETLVKLNPTIEVISYKEGNETIGYVNVFNGVGKNFIIENREYEIVVKENTNLIIPN